MNAHTPDSKCGCTVERLDVQRGPSKYYVHYCAMHRAAPEVLAALRDLRAASEAAYKSGRVAAMPFVRAGNVIAKATA